MSETPLVAYALDLGAPAVLVLTVLYRRAPFVAVAAYFAGEGPPPFSGITAEGVANVLVRMSRTQVYKHVKTLRDAGVIRPSRQVCGDGKERDGFELLIRDDEPVSGTRSGSGQQRRSGSGKPDASAAPARKTGQPQSGKPDSPVRETGRASPGNRIAQSGKPDENYSYNYELNKNCNSIGDEVDSSVNRETRARATPPAPSSDAPTSRPKARRPVTTIEGEPAGSGLTMARELLLELSQMFVPTDECGRAIEVQRIRANDPAALVLAERLLAVPLEGLDEDSARSARRDRFMYVLETCRGFADICRRSTAKSMWWGPGMLELQVGVGKTVSRWAMLERDVAEDQRAAGQAAAKARAAAEAAAAVAPRTAPESPEEAAARAARAERMQAEAAAVLASLGAHVRYGGPASARASGRPVDDADQERERRRGARREAGDERAEEADLETCRQMHAALARARQAKGEPLTAAEANTIRAKFGAKQEGART